MRRCVDSRGGCGQCSPALRKAGQRSAVALTDVGLGPRARPQAYIVANTSSSDKPKRIPWGKLLSRKEVWAIILCHFCHNWGTFILLTWMPTYYNQARLSALGTGGNVGVPATGGALAGAVAGAWGGAWRDTHCMRHGPSAPLLGLAPDGARAGLLPGQVLGCDILASGFFSVLPWVTMAVTANVGGWVADTLVARGMSVTTVRKVMQVGRGGVGGVVRAAVSGQSWRRCAVRGKQPGASSVPALAAARSLLDRAGRQDGGRAWRGACVAWGHLLKLGGCRAGSPLPPPSPSLPPPPTPVCRRLWASWGPPSSCRSWAT